jgi:hypothetical protein
MSPWLLESEIYFSLTFRFTVYLQFCHSPKAPAAILNSDHVHFPFSSMRLRFTSLRDVRKNSAGHYYIFLGKELDILIYGKKLNIVGKNLMRFFFLSAENNLEHEFFFQQFGGRPKVTHIRLDILITNIQNP